MGSAVAGRAGELITESFGERYQATRLLGEGGMGRVYEVLDRDQGTRVALKSMRDADSAFLVRFKREFRTLQQLGHPNLVTLLDLSVDSGRWFFTMELVDGQDFLRHVREHATHIVTASPEAQTGDGSDIAPEMMTSSLRWNEARLRDALAQLVRGLDYMHAAGKVHRDIKPSNVLVTASGRVVIVDFGVVAEAEREPSPHTGVVGTAGYMAPEQALGLPVGPAADLYAVGAMLYQVLTGRLPFVGSALEVMDAKQRLQPRHPGAVAPCPDDLAELAMELLRTSPQGRPTAAAVIARLGQTSVEASAARVRPGPAPGVAPFVGREAELAELHDAFSTARGGKAVAVVVEGPSGVGKTALVRELVARLAWEAPEAVVLFGRYYEREAVPYPALDAIMDAAAAYLSHLPPDAADAILPVDASLLAAHFPSLRAVPSMRRPSLPPPLAPQELRARLFQAVRELLMRLAQRRPLIVVIDDVQWSDADSRAAFAEALRPPSPPVLVLSTLRTSERADPASEPLAMLAPLELRHLRLGPLRSADARHLAATLLELSGGDDDAAAIAEEAGGHPLFIDALVRHAALVPATERGRMLRLDDALAVSVASLEPPARLLLELSATAAGPLLDRDGLRAAGLDPTAGVRALAALKQSHLVRAGRQRDEDAFEPFHDRVREVVLGKLDAPARRARHAALARALEAVPRPDPEALFFHHREAGSREEALRHGKVAAAAASAALAFDRAARLYRALAPLTGDAEERRRLTVLLGDALASAGRGLDAADAFRTATRGASPVEALELSRRAAEQLLRSGRIDEGLEAVRAVLGAVGLGYPGTPRRALAALLVRRALIRVRGTSYRRRSSDEVAASELTRLDACWSVAGVLGMVDTIRGAHFQSRHLWLALRSGEPFRVARALALEAGYSATQGSRSHARTARLFAQAGAQVKSGDDPYLDAWLRGCGAAAAGLEGRFRASAQLGCESEVIFKSRCGNVAWEMSSIQFFIVQGLAWTGQLAELRRRLPQCQREAEERGDLYGAAVHRTALAPMAWLAADDVQGARDRVREAMTHWSRGGFQTEHFWELHAEGQTDLYSEDAEGALRRVQAAWPGLEASLLRHVQLTRIESTFLRARATLAAARARAADRAALVASARRDAKRLAGEPPSPTWCAPLAGLIQAGAAAVSGDREAAARILRAVIPQLDAADLMLHASAARWRLGRLLGGDEGGALVASAESRLRAEEVARPDRFVAMLAPGF